MGRGFLGVLSSLRSNGLLSLLQPRRLEAQRGVDGGNGAAEAGIETKTGDRSSGCILNGLGAVTQTDVANCGRYERLLVLSAYRLTALSSSMVMPPSAPPPFPAPEPPLPPPPLFEPVAPAELELHELLCRMPRLQRLHVRCLSLGGVGLPTAEPEAPPPDPPAAPDPVRLSPPPSRLLVPVRNRL